MLVYSGKLDLLDRSELSLRLALLFWAGTSNALILYYRRRFLKSKLVSRVRQGPRVCIHFSAFVHIVC